MLTHRTEMEREMADSKCKAGVKVSDNQHPKGWPKLLLLKVPVFYSCHTLDKT